MKYAIGGETFLIARHETMPWHALARPVAEDIIARHHLAGGAWIVHGPIGRRLARGELRRRPRADNDPN